jgi:hypothetical protein
MVAASPGGPPGTAPPVRARPRVGRELHNLFAGLVSALPGTAPMCPVNEPGTLVLPQHPQNGVASLVRGQAPRKNQNGADPVLLVVAIATSKAARAECGQVSASARPVTDWVGLPILR